jgi:hypothetical protein
MVKLTGKELTYSMMALFTTEILKIILLNLKMGVINHNSLVTKEDLSIILLMERVAKRELIINFKDNTLMAIKLMANLRGTLITKDILTKEHLTITTCFMGVVNIFFI